MLPPPHERRNPLTGLLLLWWQRLRLGQQRLRFLLLLQLLQVAELIGYALLSDSSGPLGHVELSAAQQPLQRRHQLRHRLQSMARQMTFGRSVMPV